MRGRSGYVGGVVLGALVGKRSGGAGVGQCLDWAWVDVGGRGGARRTGWDAVAQGLCCGGVVWCGVALRGAVQCGAVR
jgi:hypothetical protein